MATDHPTPNESEDEVPFVAPSLDAEPSMVEAGLPELHRAALGREAARTKPAADALIELCIQEIDHLLRSKALRYTRNHYDAEDLLQEVYMKLFRNYSQLKSPHKMTSVKSWCLTAMHNEYINGWRKNQRIPPILSIDVDPESVPGWEALEPPAPGFSTEEEVIDHQFIEDIVLIATDAGLPGHQVEVLKRCLEETSDSDSEAHATPGGRSSDADRQAKSRTLKKIRDLIGINSTEYQAFRAVNSRVVNSRVIKNEILPRAAAQTYVNSLNGQAGGAEAPKWLAGLTPGEQVDRTMSLYESLRDKTLHFFNLDGQ